VVTVVKGADASLAVCGTIVEANGAQHAVLALAVKGNTKRDNLPGLILHWYVLARSEGNTAVVKKQRPPLYKTSCPSLEYIPYPSICLILPHSLVITSPRVV